jgi:GT2 family glycosyltransferase
MARIFRGLRKLICSNNILCYISIVNSPPKVSIIIVNFNGEMYLDNCLQSIQGINYPNFETILVDNHSIDNSLYIVEQRFPEVYVIKLEKNVGFAKGNNIGAEHANGEFLAFLNNDTTVDWDWLTELMHSANLLGADSVFSSKVLFMDDPSRINTVGGRITPLGGGFDIAYGETDSDMYDKIMTIGTPAGCSMLINRSVFLDLDGFDEDYFAYFEDVDIGWRCWLAGYSVYYVPTSVIYHKGGGTSGPMDSPLRVFNGRKNRLKNITKNFSWCNLIFGLVYGVIFDCFEFMLFISKGKGLLGIEIIRGYISFFKGIKKTRNKRKQIQEHRTMSDSELKKLKIIASYVDCVGEYIRVKNIHEERENY